MLQNLNETYFEQPREGEWEGGGCVFGKIIKRTVITGRNVAIAPKLGGSSDSSSELLCGSSYEL